MKKILILTLLLLTVGCTNKKEKLFEKYGRQYYENHMKFVKNIDTVTITLKDLRNSKKDNYDLKKLQKCDSSSYITFNIDENKKIKNYKIDLNC